MQYVSHTDAVPFYSRSGACSDVERAGAVMGGLRGDGVVVVVVVVVVGRDGEGPGREGGVRSLKWTGCGEKHARAVRSLQWCCLKQAQRGENDRHCRHRGGFDRSLATKLPACKVTTASVWQASPRLSLGRNCYT